MLGLLQNITVPPTPPATTTKSGLEVLLQTWTENAETFQGFWAGRINTLALMDLFVASFAPGGERLRGVMVKGELVVKAETRDGESVCSSYRAPSRSGDGGCMHKDAMLMGPSRCGSDHDPLAHQTKYAWGVLSLP